MKVNLSPSRKPGFQWLGIQGICLHQENQNADATASEHLVQDPLPASSENISEAASSTATAASRSGPHKQQAGHFQVGQTISRSNSQSLSSKGLKRSAACSPPPTMPHKRSRTQSEPLSAPAHLDIGTSGVQPTNSLEHALSASVAELCNSELALVRPECSPGLPEKRNTGDANKAGLRPTPVPVTPEGAQPEAQHLQRQQVKPGTHNKCHIASDGQKLLIPAV